MKVKFFKFRDASIASQQIYFRAAILGGRRPSEAHYTLAYSNWYWPKKRYADTKSLLQEVYDSFKFDGDIQCDNYESANYMDVIGVDKEDNGEWKYYECSKLTEIAFDETAINRTFDAASSAKTNELSSGIEYWEELVRKGFEYQKIKLIKITDSDTSFSEIVCKIGNYMISFGGIAARECKSVEELLEKHSMESVIFAIAQAIYNFFPRIRSPLDA